MLCSAKTRFVLLSVLMSAMLAGGCAETYTRIKDRFILPAPSVQELEAGHTDPDYRRTIIVRMTRHPKGREEPWLSAYAALLKTDGSPLVRAAAARALGKCRAHKYVPNLAIALAHDPSPDVRWDAAAALDLVPGEEAVQPLQAASIDDPSSNVRAAAAYALRHYRKREVVETLVTVLTDESFAVRYEAHRALVEVTGHDYGYEARHWTPMLDKHAKLPPRPSSRSWWDPFGLFE